MVCPNDQNVLGPHTVMTRGTIISVANFGCSLRAILIIRSTGLGVLWLRYSLLLTYKFSPKSALQGESRDHFYQNLRSVWSLYLCRKVVLLTSILSRRSFERGTFPFHRNRCPWTWWRDWIPVYRSPQTSCLWRKGENIWFFDIYFDNSVLIKKQ